MQLIYDIPANANCVSTNTHKFYSKMFKAWLTDLTKIQGVINNIKDISTWTNGATRLLNTDVVKSLSDAINGLNLQQAQLALSTKNLSNEQMNQILVQAGLKASEDHIQAELVQSALAQAHLSDVKKNAILVEARLMDAETLELFSSRACTKEKLVAALAVHGYKGATADAIISTLGLTAANEGATVSFGLFTAATWAQVKAQLALMASNPMTWIMLIPAIVGVAAKAFDALTVSTKEVKEAVEEAKNTINDIKSDFDNLSSTTDDIKQRFAELAQGVENLGKVNQSRGKLSAEDYEEFLDLSNQIAELFPQLTRGYDDNGNAILGLSGNVNSIIGSLNDLIIVQQKLANQQILEKMPDVWKGYTAELDEYNKELDESEKKVNSYQKVLDQLVSGNKTGIVVNNMKENQEISQALRNIGIDNKRGMVRQKFDEYGQLISAEWDFSSLTDAQIEQLKNEFGALGSEYEDSVQQAKNKIESANSEMSAYINTWLSGEWNYSKMDSGMQNVVKDALLSTDWLSQLPDDIDANNWEEVSNWLQNEFLYAVNAIDNEKIKTALVDAFDGEFTVKSLQGIIDQLLTTEGFDQNNPLIIYLQTKLDNRQEKVDSVRNRMDASDSTATDWINSLNEEELALADSDEFEQTIETQKEKLNGASLAAKDYENALQGIKDKQDGQEAFSNLSLSEALNQPAGEGDDTYSDIINAYEQQRASLQSYLDKIANNTFESSDKLSLATEFGITGDSIDELPTRIKSLMDLNLDGIIKKIDHLLNDSTLSGQAKNDLRNLKQSIIDINTEAKKASPIKIDAEVSSLSDIQSLSTGLKQLGDIYNDVKDGKEFDWSSILNNESFTKEFGNLVRLLGID